MATVGKFSAATKGPVLIVGTGLIGTSLALALRAKSVPVYLWDPSPTMLALAADIGGGTRLSGDPTQKEWSEGGLAPSIVVVAAPPDVSGTVVTRCLAAFPEAVITDVASVKEAVLEDIWVAHESQVAGGGAGLDLARFVGSHPMAGRARSGASHADGDLFIGRPWVIVPTEHSADESVLAIRSLAADVGAVPLELGPTDHDQAVALVSHVPQLVSSLLAARLAGASLEALGLAGQGLRDTTRIAASDPGLWTAIIAGNAAPVAHILGELRDDLDALVRGLTGETIGEGRDIAPGVAGAIASVIAAGNTGVERIPGKHGQAPRRWGYVEVLVPDKPGELGRLFTDMGDIGVNLEDLVLEHSVGQPVALARVMIDPGRVDETESALEARAWTVASKALRS